MVAGRHLLWVALFLALGCKEKASPPRISVNVAQAGSVYEYGSHAASVMKCGDELVWMSKPGPTGRETELWAASLPLRSEQPLSPRRVLALQDGGTLQYLQTAGDWAVFTDFKQHGTDPWADWWKLILVNLKTGNTQILASASTEPMTKQPPRASISSEAVVWDEPQADGSAVIKLYDVKASKVRTLPLPKSVHPTQPFLVSDRIVFLDASTDHVLGSGLWFFLGGTVSIFDLRTKSFHHLKSSPPEVREMTVSGDRFAWVNSAKDPRYASGSVFQIELGYLDGRPGEVVGYGQGHLTGKYLIRNDPLEEALVVSALERGRSVIAVNGFAKFNAVCGDRLYFPVWRNDVEGSIRVLQL